MDEVEGLEFDHIKNTVLLKFYFVCLIGQTNLIFRSTDPTDIVSLEM